VGAVIMGRRILTRGVRLLSGEPRAEVDEELRFHIEERVREYVARGMSPEAARRAAQERFGDVEAVRRVCAELLAAERKAEARRDWLDDLRQDLRLAVRNALRAPLFTLLAIATLALGIGANAAVFGVLKSVLLDALPYPEGERLVQVTGSWDGADQEGVTLSAGAVEAVRERQRSFESVAAYSPGLQEPFYMGESGPQVVTAGMVGTGFFGTLGVPALLGRTITAADRPPEAPAVVLLGHDFWQREFGGDPAVLGTTISFNNGVPREVIGVLPPGFVGPMGAADIWLPLNLQSMLDSPVSAWGTMYLGLLGRLRPGVTLAAAQQELESLSAGFLEERADVYSASKLKAVPLRQALVGETRAALLVLLASAALVLLIACANLAAALLSRALSRRKEFAVRVALGAGRGRLVRQLLAESALLGLAGGAAGLLLAWLGLALVQALAPPALPPYAELSLDGGAILVTALGALAAGLAFGLVPALAAGRQEPQPVLREEGRGGEGRRSGTVRGVLVAGQIAISVSLLVGAGLLGRSLWEMANVPLGFQAEGVLAVDVTLPWSMYPGSEATAPFYDELEARLATLPGVTGVATTCALPGPSGENNSLNIEGVTWPDEAPFIPFTAVSDDYFVLMGIPLLAGRVFGPEDRADAPQGIVISEALARRYWPAGDALGARIRLGPDQEADWAQVVGIVGDVRGEPTATAPQPMTYASFRAWSWGNRTVVLRTGGAPLELVPAVRRELAALDPAIPLRNPRTVERHIAAGLADRRLPVLLVSSFGILALILASVGVYAMFAALAAAREREFGVRMALGASRRAIAGLVVRQGTLWLVAGLAAGLAGVGVVARLLQGHLYGVPAFDPLALGAALLALVACAALALLVPLRRATRADPLTALR
jgi:putative ABC transport system permease protein